MNKYLDFYSSEKLRDLKFNEAAKKALIFSLSGLALGFFGVLFAPIAQLNDFSFSNLFLGCSIGIIIFLICFSINLKLKKLNNAKQILQSNINEIENKLFVEESVLREKTLIGVSKENQLFIMGKNIEGEFHTYLATNDYLHYSPVKLDQFQVDLFDKTISGEKGFKEITKI